MRLKQLFKNKAVLICFVVVYILLLLIPTVSVLIAAAEPNTNESRYYMPDYATKAEALEAGNALSAEIVEEGAVLLKNAGALPIATSAGSKTKISVFGKNSVSLMYGGSGSGGGTHENAKTLYDSLSAANYDYNPTLEAFYRDDSASGKGRSNTPAIEDRGATKSLDTGETPWTDYTQTVQDSFSGYKTAALVVITRIGGEGWDLPRANGHANPAVAGDHFLRLDADERAMLAGIKAAGFTNIVILLNSNNAMELGFLDDAAYGITGCLWIGSPGDAGIMGLGGILSGAVSPSGRTVDTYSRDFTQDPVWANFGDGNQKNGQGYFTDANATGDDNASITYVFADYEEDIYVGYRYFETRAYIESSDADSTWAYEDHVVFPFGYGLSYGSFTQRITGVKPSALTKDKFTLSVEVTHEASSGYAQPARDAVQVYVTAPYTDGGIEKARVVLAGAAKSPLIAKGESAAVEVEIDPYLFSSYDTKGAQCFVLDAGAYEFTLAKNAHVTEAANVYESFTASVAGKIAYKDGAYAEVKNRYMDADDELNPASLLKRSDDFTVMPASRTTQERILSAATKAAIDNKETNNDIYVTDELYPNTEAENDMPFSDLVGVPYEDALWDLFLDQLSISEMTKLATDGQFKTESVLRLKIPATNNADGPFGFVNFMGDTTVSGCTYYPSEVVLASTWNTELAYKMGVMVGNESLIGNEQGDGLPYSGWYAPGVNIHRSPFGGRNGEYYSEDPFMSGKMAAALIKGARSKGVMTFVKHFAVNDQETSRTGLSTWLTEQALREIYLRPFEMAVTEGGTLGVMTSFNRIGTVWAGGDYRLLTEILRGEWGFKGFVVCDYFVGNEVADPTQMIYAGGDLHLMAVTADWFQPDPASATDITILRTATKNILYAVANSNITDYDIIGYRLAVWEIIMIVIDVILIVGLAVWGFLVIWRLQKKLKQSNPSAA